MEGLCKDCHYFEPKGVIIDRNTWGLCKQLIKKDQSERGTWETGVFRWGDSSCCTDFKVRKEMVGHTKNTK